MAETSLGKAYVQIVPSAEGISGKISNALAPGAETAGDQAGLTVSKSMGSKISAMGGKFIKAGAIATGISVPIIKGFQDALSAYETQATAESKLTEIYKTRMGVSDKAAKSTMNLASKLQQQGIIGDEVAISGAQQLATFAKYPDTINTLLPSMENLLAQQKGVNATTDDAVNIGNLMGKVMQGQTGALKRVGISFTDAQEDVLKYGTEQEKAAMLAEVINSNVGDMNKTLANTPSGQIQQMKNALGDAKEEIGAALAPTVAKLAQYVSEKVLPVVEKIIKFIQDHPIIGKIAVAVAGLLAVGGPLLMMLGGIMTVLPIIGGAFTALAGPVGIVIGIIAGLVTVGIILYKNWDKIKAVASKVKDAVIKAFTKLKDTLAGVFKALGTMLTAPFKKAWEFIKGIVKKIKDVFKFKVSLPKIKLPHFKVDPPGWKLSDLLKGSIPSLGIDWYAKGGIVDRPTVLGAGDVRGGEGIVPLNPFWAKLDQMADSIVSGVATVAAAGAGGGDITIPIYLYPNGPKMGEETVKMYDRYKKRLG